MAFLRLATRKAPALAATGRELTIAAGSLFTTRQAVRYGSELAIELGYVKKPSADDPSSTTRAILDKWYQFAAGVQLAGGVLSIAIYGGLARLSAGTDRFRWFPPPSRRSPMTIPRVAAAGGLTLVLSPVVSLLCGIAALPVIQQFHSSFGESDAMKAEETEVRKDCDEGRSAPTATSPPSKSGERAASTGSASAAKTPCDCIQKSVGTSIVPVVESAMPGIGSVVIPLYEEVFFRGLLFARLVPCSGCLPATLMSSALFAGFHTGVGGSPYLPLQEAILGCAFSLLYFWTGRLLVPVALHSGVNSFSLLVWATLSAPMTASDLWHFSKYGDEHTVRPPDLSFWERRAAQIYGSSRGVAGLAWLESWFMDDAATSEGGPPFLPLDFWGTKEQASPQGVFFDSQNGRLLKAPALSNADGAATAFAETLIDDYINVHLGWEDSISVDKYIGFCVEEKRLELAFHILATMPEQAETPPTLMDCVNYFKSLEGEQQDQFNDIVQRSIGLQLLMHPSGKISRLEMKEAFTRSLQLGYHSHVNRDLFIFYCKMVEVQGGNPSISGLLAHYCTILPEALSQGSAEGKDLVEMD